VELDGSGVEVDGVEEEDGLVGVDDDGSLEEGDVEELLESVRELGSLRSRPLPLPLPFSPLPLPRSLLVPRLEPVELRD
jgi:hypothetical protein